MYLDSGSASRVRRWGVAVLSLTGVLAVGGASLLNRWSATGLPEPVRAAWPGWFPDLLVAGFEEFVEPWPVLLVSATGLTVLLGLAGLASLTLARGCRWTRKGRFVAFWIITWVVGLGVELAGRYGEFVAAAAGTGGAFAVLRDLFLPAALQASAWAALWGWLPALLAALAGGRAADDTPHVGRWRVLGLVLVASAVLAGLSLVEVSRRSALAVEPVASVPAQPAPHPTTTR